MKKGRERVQTLGERLESVRQKVEENGERDKEGELAAERRLKMLWGFLGFWGALVLVLMVARHWPRVGVDVRGGRLVELANQTWDGMENGIGSGLKRANVVSGEGGGRQKEMSMSEKSKSTSIHEDPLLKLFDEL